MLDIGRLAHRVFCGKRGDDTSPVACYEKPTVSQNTYYWPELDLVYRSWQSSFIGAAL